MTPAFRRILILSSISALATTRPQKNKPTETTPMCKEYEGYRCVPAFDCIFNKTIVTGEEDLIAEIFHDGASILGVRTADGRPEDASCSSFDIRSGQAEPICCRELDIVPDANSNNEQTNEPKAKEKCSEFADAGYKCVSKIKCNGVDTRNGLKEGELATCEETATSVRQADSEEMVCCHETDLSDSEHKCDDFAEEGYSCVEKSKCLPPKSSSSMSKLTCPEPSTECCHADNLIKTTTTEKPPERSCAVFFRDGFKCVPKSNCLDEVIERNGEKVVVVRTQNIFSGDNYRPRNGVCPITGDVCCLNEKPVEVFVPENQDKKCGEIEGYMCLAATKECNGEVLKDDSAEHNDVLDIRNQLIEIDTSVSKCPGDLEVCCKPKPKKFGKKVVAPPRVQQTYQPKCGQHNAQGVAITIRNPQEGEFASQFGEWPHACLVYDQKTQNDIFIGGASLIAPGIVVTAAHKVDKMQPSHVKVRCGEWNVQHMNEPILHQDRTASQIVMHPAYSGSKRVENDFALIFVDEEFELNKHIDTICLPEEPSVRSGQYQGKGCVAMGWGKDRHEGGSYQVSMRQVTLPIVPNNQCQHNLRKYTRLSNNFDLHESFLCAGGEEGRDTCEGDGGGSLVCPDGDKYVLAGIVAWGIGCGQKNVPGVYAATVDGLCFIHLAAKCHTGNKYEKIFDNQRCQNWIDEEIDRQSINADPMAPTYLARAQALKSSCQSSVDLSSFAKRGGDPGRS